MNIRAGAFVPPGSQLDAQSVGGFPRSMNNPGSEVAGSPIKDTDREY